VIDSYALGRKPMRLFRAAAYTFCAALLLLDVAGAAVAQTPAEFFKGRNVNLLIGFGVGGDDDLWGRVIAKHMGDHLPGYPTVVPQNVPGAGGLLVANRLYSVAPRDGTVIGMINRGIPFEPLLGGQGANFDVLKMNWIGSPNRDTTVCAARKDAAVQSMRDLFILELKIGATGSGADTATYPEFLSAVVGMKFKVVRGYQGSHEIQLAMERNEVQGICLAYDSLARGTLFRTNGLNVLLQAALDPDPRLDNVPSGIDFVHSDEERQALELFFARAAIGRPLVAPPQIPADRVAALRRAFDETLIDRAFLADAEAQKLRVDPTTGQKLQEIVAKAYRTPPAIVKRTMQAMGRTN
jgi:tripartite-type tricarboxylate transporter receptor subunit TctC